MEVIGKPLLNRQFRINAIFFFALHGLLKKESIEGAKKKQKQ